MKDFFLRDNLKDMIIDDARIKELVEKMELDPVAGVYNKYAFIEYVEKLLKDNPDTDYDLVCICIEGYHQIFDRYGQMRCHKMFRNIGDKLKAFLPKNTLIGKVGEAQFAFIVNTQSIPAHENAMKQCLKLFSESAIAGVATKCGVYQHVDHDMDGEMICYNAILAAEKIKNLYGTSLAVYDSSIRENASREQFIIDNMSKALALRQFIVYYQPKFNLRDEKVNGAEALVRWIHPEAGFMNPGEFISVFEHNGFIQELDRYMLDSVCRDLRSWADEGRKLVPVSINVSQANFDNKNLADEFIGIVDSYKIPHELIHFEITESLNAADTQKKINSVEKLRDNGFQIELDDYGSGYSSMIALCDMPIDILKLDMSLVQRMFEKKHSAVLSGALFTARELALKVVAEGIETKEQVEEMKWRGSYISEFSIQGYYYSKPLPKLQFENYLTIEPEEKEDTNNIVNSTVKSAFVDRQEPDGVNSQYDREIQTQKYKTLMEIPGTVIYDYNPKSDKMSMEVQHEDGQIVRRSAEKYLELLPTKHWINDNDIDRYIETIRSVMIYGNPKSVRVQALTKEGGYQLCVYHFAPLKDDTGKVVRVVGRAEVAETDQSASIENKPVCGTFRYRNDSTQAFDYVSEALINMLGFENEDAFRRFYGDTFINFVYDEDRSRVIREIEKQISDGYVDYCEYRVRKADGSLLWVYDKGTLFVDEYGNEHFYVSVTDLDEYKLRQINKQRSQDMMHLRYKSESRQDKMTKLDNKDYSLRLIKKYLDSGDKGTFFMIDIDGFKQINDTRGHDVGDRVLCDMAEILRTVFRNGDVVGRYGGDEFICYMPGINKKDVAETKADDILERVEKVHINEKDSLGVSIGIVTDVLSAKGIGDLVDMANKALNDTRMEGKGKYCFY